MPTGKTRKTDRRTLYTRQVIRDAYYELLADHEPQQITVTELCRRAEINRSTFYLHYTDSLSVLEELMTDVIDYMTAFAQNMSDTTGINWQVGRDAYEQLMADERMGFLLMRCMAYPPFISALSDAMATAAMPSYRLLSDLSDEDLHTVLQAVYYSNLVLDAKWLRHGDLADLEHKNDLFNRYIYSPAHDALTGRAAAGETGRAKRP